MSPCRLLDDGPWLGRQSVRPASRLDSGEVRLRNDEAQLVTVQAPIDANHSTKLLISHMRVFPWRRTV